MSAAMAEKQQQGPGRTIEQLFADEPDRLSRMSIEAAAIYFDWSKTHLDAKILEEFTKRAESAGFAAARDALFAGDVVNPSEGRAATHVAERGSGAPADVDLAAARRQRMRALVDAIEGGAFGNVTGVLHIGIGGSVLGPALLVDALGRRSSTLTVRFLSNIDGAAFDDAVKPLDPATTLVVAASKTFTTQETLANLDAARAWLRSGSVGDPDGILNGAAIRLRTIHAITTSDSTNRARLQPLSSWVLTRRRRDVGKRIRPLVSARRAPVKPGWQLRRAPLCPPQWRKNSSRVRAGRSSNCSRTSPTA
jgi:glucose-6-phosphate isomerase